jgi:hypothetical protein
MKSDGWFSLLQDEQSFVGWSSFTVLAGRWTCQLFLGCFWDFTPDSPPLKVVACLQVEGETSVALLIWKHFMLLTMAAGFSRQSAPKKPQFSPDGKLGDKSL